MKWYYSNGVWKTRSGKPVEVFPIQIYPTQYRNGYTPIPLEIAQEAYKEYSAQYGTQQSLERLAERGGFGVAEIAMLLYDRIKGMEEIDG